MLFVIFWNAFQIFLEAHILGLGGLEACTNSGGLNANFFVTLLCDKSIAKTEKKNFLKILKLSTDNRQVPT